MTSVPKVALPIDDLFNGISNLLETLVNVREFQALQVPQWDEVLLHLGFLIRLASLHLP
jgi:hypothetical protein